MTVDWAGRLIEAEGLPKSLVTDEGIYRYKLVDGVAVERTAEEIAAEISAIPEPKAAPIEIIFRALAQADTVTPDEANDNADLFPLWGKNIGKRAEAGSYWRHGDNLYRVNAGQGHTIQADWPPDQAASLFSLAANPAEEWPDWIQPTGAHNAYAKGAKVSHNSKRWVSTADGNVWSPGAYGWVVQ